MGYPPPAVFAPPPPLSAKETAAVAAVRGPLHVLQPPAHRLPPCSPGVGANRARAGPRSPGAARRGDSRGHPLVHRRLCLPLPARSAVGRGQGGGTVASDSGVASSRGYRQPLRRRSGRGGGDWQDAAPVVPGPARTACAAAAPGVREHDRHGWPGALLVPLYPSAATADPSRR